jgi:hypothetical protein
MRTRQASAKPIGTLEYFSISFTTGSIFSATVRRQATRGGEEGVEIGSTALPEKMKSLRQNGFARGPRRRRLGRLCHRPPVVSVSAAKQRYNKSSVNEDVSGHNR